MLRLNDGFHSRGHRQHQIGLMQQAEIIRDRDLCAGCLTPRFDLGQPIEAFPDQDDVRHSFRQQFGRYRPMAPVAPTTARVAPGRSIPMISAAFFIASTALTTV